MKGFNAELKRTDYAGALGPDRTGDEVVLAGWVQRRRDHGGVIFVDLRDREGLVQVVINPAEGKPGFDQAHLIRSEYVLAVAGAVRRRPEGMENPALKTGMIEVVADRIEILNESKTPPFSLDLASEVAENIRLQYRYLDLRRPEIQKNLILRSQIAREVREYFAGEGFIEVETPFLTKSTPEGARDFLVPSRINPGMFYALPQSPQLFKQLLMVSGLDRYYQIVRCFRDEDLRADRQPEFTQIDVEMSFVNEEDVITVVEGLFSRLFQNCLGKELKTPFPRLPYREAIARYGKDNPDIRFGLELIDLTDLLKETAFRPFAENLARGGIIKALLIEDGSVFSRKDLDDLKEVVAPYGAKGLAWARVTPEGWTSPLAKHLSPSETAGINERTGAKTGSVILFLADVQEVVHTALGHLRLYLGRRLNLYAKDTFSFTWVTDFPLFEYSETQKRYVSTHHPFTSPHPADLSFIEEDPGRVRARAYDLVLNGSEIGGGSIRIHRKELQTRIFTALGLTREEAEGKFGFLLEALQYGTPPHGGIAFGLDRMIMIMTGGDSIRDVIAFPKTQRGTCLLTDAPSEVALEQLMELSLKIV